MTQLLHTAHAAGATTNGLIPSTHRFYRGLGYGIAGRRSVFALATAELRAIATPRLTGLRLRRTRPADAAAVASLVRDRAARGSGLLDHSGADERAVEDPSGGDSSVAEVGGLVRGWCLLGRQSAATRYANYDVVVHDLVADDAGVELALWRLLVADHPSALRAVAPLLPGSLVEHHLERQQEVLDNASWMARLLDVDAALTQRRYPTSVSVTFHLSVTDPACPWNEGTRRLVVADGTARIEPAPQARPDILVGGADQASLSTGYADPGQLALTHEHLTATLRALFAGPPAWLARPF